MEATLEEKQRFLTEEILDKHYDQTKFVNFCLSKKENGDDISLWTMEELKDLIKEFHEQEAPIAQSEEKPGDEVQQPPSDQPKLPEVDIIDEEQKQENPQLIEEPKKENNINLLENQIKDAPSEEVKKSVVVSESETMIEIECKKLDKTALNDREVKVIIQNPQRVEKKLLSHDYVLYEVVTKGQEEWKVNRRYNDFLWLRGALIKYNPGQVIPPLPSKQIGNKRFDQEFILKRMSFLQRFIDVVMENEIFKACECLNMFLSLEDRTQFEAKMKLTNQFVPTGFVEDFKTFSGTVKISKEIQDNEKYFGKISQYFDNQEILYDRLNEGMKKINEDFQQIVKHIAQVQEDFETFFILNDRVVMKKGITKTYEQLGSFFKNYGKILIKQNDSFQYYIKDFFKFIRNEGSSYQELIKNREVIKSRYLDARNKLNSRKEKLFHNKDTSKWEIEENFANLDTDKLKSDKDYAFKHMLTKDSSKVDSMQKQFGYVNKMNFDELSKMIDFNCEKFRDNLSKFSVAFYATITDLIGAYSDIKLFIETNPEIPLDSEIKAKQEIKKQEEEVKQEEVKEEQEVQQDEVKEEQEVKEDK